MRFRWPEEGFGACFWLMVAYAGLATCCLAGVICVCVIK